MRIASAEALARMLAERLAESGEPDRAVTVAQLVERILPYPLVRERLGLAGKAEYDLAVLRLLTDRVLLQLDPALHEAATKELDQPEPDLRPLEKLSESLLRVRHPRRIAASTDPGPEAEAGDIGPEASSEERAAVSETRAEPELVAEPEPVAEPERVAESEPEPVAESEPQPTVEPGPVVESEPAASVEPEAVTVSEPEAVVGPDPLAEPERDAAVDPGPATLPVADAPGATACWSCAAPLPDREGVRFCTRCGVDQHAARCISCGDRLEPGWCFCPRCGRALSRP